VKILTVEIRSSTDGGDQPDPVKPQIDLTFANALRSIVRRTRT